MSAAQPHKSPRAVVPESFPIDDAFDVDFVDALAQQETYNKHHYRPNSYLHKWWARRCGTTFRAILKHLVTDGEQCAFYASGGLEGKIILDPMMGGGTTVHEAVRLNANVIGADIDPIPILQARAALTEIDIGRLEHAFHTLLDKLQSAMGHHYATHCPDCGDTHAVQFTLYSLCAACDCRNVRLVDSFVLRHNSDDSIVHIDPENGAVMHDGQIIAAGDQLNPLPFVAKKDKRCPRCHVVYRADSSQPFFRRYEPFAVVTHCPHTGLRYLPARHSDRERSAVLDEMRDTLGFDSAEFPLAPGPKSDNLRQHGAASYLDVFGSRQLLFLRHACDIISTFEPAVRLNFALLLSTSLEFNSLLCGYKGALKSRPGAVRHTFTRHAYTIPATALEVNPLYERRTSGTLRNLFFGRLVQGKRWAAQPVERRIDGDEITTVPIHGETDFGREVTSYNHLREGKQRFMLLQGSSAELPLPDATVDFVVTDPPYFDSVQYGDLAAYFRVWLRQMLPDDATWHYDLNAAAVDQHANGNGQYDAVLGAIFGECRRVLRPDGRLIFTFHHWKPQAWAALTVALMQSGFSLVNRYVVHAENLTSIHIANQNALLHDVILVLASAENQRRTWATPDTIDKSDSRAFCESCGTALGALLQSELSPLEVAHRWKTLLE